MRSTILTLATLLTLTCTGCVDAATEDADAGASPSASDDLDRRQGRELQQLPERAPVAGQGTVGEVPESVLQLAFDWLHASTGVQQQQVEVLTAEEAVWPSGALGCGKPGRTYQQVPVSGHRVVIRAEGRSYDLRIAGALVHLCEQEVPVAHPTP